MKLPKPGSILLVVQPFHTLAGVSYEKGDRLELIEPTGQAPFGFESNLGNWIVKCRYFTPPDPHSIWSGIWLMLEAGLVVIE